MEFTKEEMNVLKMALEDRLFNLSLIIHEAEDEDRDDLIGHCKLEIEKAEKVYIRVKDELGVKSKW